jgi:hypothetical protein
MSPATCIATVAACLLALAAAATEIPEPLRKSIASGNQDWIEGIKAHDAGRIAATYDEQAIFHNASLPDR